MGNGGGGEALLEERVATEKTNHPGGSVGGLRSGPSASGVLGSAIAHELSCESASNHFLRTVVLLWV